jgi:hypothetical protein
LILNYFISWNFFAATWYTENNQEFYFNLK